jgi:PhnB protein
MAQRPAPSRESTSRLLDNGSDFYKTDGNDEFYCERRRGLMAGESKGIPEGASAVIPRLFCRDPEGEIGFCTRTFNAVELSRRPGADGKTAHALITIGPAMLMIESEWPQIANRPPSPDGSSPVVLYVYVENVDETVTRAEAAGAKVLMAPTNQFWGDRTAWIIDPCNHVWTVATRVEEPTEEERKGRLAEIHAKSGPSST